MYLLLIAAAIASNSGKSLPDTVSHDLTEVNVVTIKQEAKLKGEAISASILSRQELEQMNAVSIKGVSDAVPNLYIPDYGSRITSSIYVRGIGARMDQPAVGLSVDNVPYLNKNAYDFDLSDIASVEMMRGPQSALYGRNTMGGLINITTLSPMSWQGWRFMVSGGMGNDWKASVGWYHKFSENLATSVTGSFSYLRGFFKNQFNNQYLDKERQGGLRWKMNWRLNQKIYVQNVLSTSLLRQGGYPYENIATGEINYNDTCFYRRFTLNEGLTLNYRGEGWTLTSMTSVQHIDDNMTLDQDFLPVSYFTLTQKQRETGVTEDLIAKGSKLSGDYKWLAGVFGFYKNMEMNAPVTFKDTGISYLIESHRNAANPDYPIAWYSREFPLNSEFEIPTYGVALYHESKYDLGRWHFTAGIRLDWERSVLHYRSHCDTGYEIYSLTQNYGYEPYRNVDIKIDDTGRISRQYFTWMPKASVLYELNGETGNVYASVSRGYKSGGFNTQMFSDVLQQRLMFMMGIGRQYDIDEIVGYKPEYSWNYEIGSHLSFAEGKVLADLTAFYINCRDQQVTMFPSGTTTGRIMANAGKTRSIGGELSLKWLPIDNWEFNGSYGFTDARFIEFNNGIEDYKGKRIPYAPMNTLFFQGLYTVKTQSKLIERVVLDLNVRGTGKVFWNESNTQYQNFYALAGASVALEGKNWSIQLWGKNLTGTKYDTFYFMSMGNEFLQKGRPIQAGATIRFNITTK